MEVAAHRVCTLIKDLADRGREKVHLGLGAGMIISAVLAVSFPSSSLTAKPASVRSIGMWWISPDPASSMARNLLLLTCGTHAQVVRVIPPLVTTDDEVDLALGTIGGSLDAIGA